MTRFTFKKQPLEYGEFRMRLYMNDKPVGKPITFFVDQSFEDIAKRLLIAFTADKSRPMDQRHQAVDLCKLIREKGAAVIPWHGKHQEACTPERETQHHPECQCAACIYGADGAQWLFNPGEY